MTSTVARLDLWHILCSYRVGFFTLALLNLEPNPLWLEWPDYLVCVLVAALTASVTEKHRCFWTELEKDTQNMQILSTDIFVLTPNCPPKSKRRLFLKKNVCF